jgi:putative phosphoribosyl transferase
MFFRDRRDAGQRLAGDLLKFVDQDVVVVGLPRGGVPVAAEVAGRLGAPLDVIVVRKLGVPFQPELGMGAVGEDGVEVLDHEMVRAARVSPEELATIEARERTEVERRARRLRGSRARTPLAGRTVIVVDDGVATGSTVRAALQVARAHGASHVVLAVPVAPPDTVRALRREADEVVCLETPEPFVAVGRWYDQFPQVSDAEVLDLLAGATARRADTHRPVPVPADDPPDDPSDDLLRARDDDVELRVDSRRLFGRLTVPRSAIGTVLFAHGSGSSRHSPRNRFVAGILNQARVATLLFDLLTPDEALDRRKVFDVEMLAHRLSGATDLVRREDPSLPIGYFGASTGAAAALWAAADDGADIAAVVSRGGRPDLAASRLGLVCAPTLLIVGGLDLDVLQLNHEAAQHLRCEHRFEIVPGATHLFEEAGTLERAAALARSWFSTHLRHGSLSAR